MYTGRVETIVLVSVVDRQRSLDAVPQFGLACSRFQVVGMAAIPSIFQSSCDQCRPIACLIVPVIKLPLQLEWLERTRGWS